MSETAERKLIRLELACEKIFGITTRRYRQLADEGRVPKVVDGEIEFLPAVKALIEYYRSLASGQDSTSTLTDERIRLTRAQADVEELKRRKMLGELVEVETAMRLWGQVVSAVRAGLLAMPTSMARDLVGMKTVVQCKTKLDEYVFDMLKNLSNPELTDARSAGHKEGAKHVCASPEADGKSVGGRKKRVVSRKQRRAR